MSERSVKKVQYRYCNNESVDELANLEAEFRNAYVVKALEAQIAEKQADRIAQEARDKLSSKLLTLQDEKIIGEEIERKCAESKKREEYKLILEEQMESKINTKLCQDEIDRTERENLIELDKIIDEEYENTKLIRRSQLAERLNRERLIFEEMREIRHSKEIEAEKIASENQRKYLEDIEKRSLEMREMQAEQRRKRETMLAAVAKLFVDNETKKHERESIISDLISETIKEESLIAEHEFECKMREKKLKLAEDLKEQMLFEVESEARSRERDRIFADEVMAKIMEDERVSILTAEAKRRKQVIYKKELEAVIDQRRVIRDAAVAALRAEWKEAKLSEEIRCQKIKEKRQGLIKEHLEQISKYLRKGVLSKEEGDLFLAKKS